MNETDKYDDIINLPHHVSETRPRMPMRDRAAQFAPFAALTGYGAAVDETARLTGQKLRLTDEQSALLDLRLKLLCERADERPEIEAEYFVRDEKKSGGSYVRITGLFRRFDEYEKNIILQDGRIIPAEDIYRLESGIFPAAEDTEE